MKLHWGGTAHRMVLQCLVGRWQVQLILWCVKVMLWLQPAALVTAYTEIAYTVTGYKRQIAASD